MYPFFEIFFKDLVYNVLMLLNCCTIDNFKKTVQIIQNLVFILNAKKKKRNLKKIIFDMFVSSIIS